MLFNPIIAILYNEKTNRWHPILFKESPLPGSFSEEKPIRHKSHGHHTTGFDTREEALLDIETSKDITVNCPNIKKCISEDISWDGESMPVIVAFFNKEGTKLLL